MRCYPQSPNSHSLSSVYNPIHAKKRTRRLLTHDNDPVQITNLLLIVRLSPPASVIARLFAATPIQAG